MAGSPPPMNLEQARAFVRQCEAAASSSTDLANMLSYQEAKRRVMAHEGPRDGHQFHFSVACQGASSVAGDPDSHRDDDWIGEPFTVTVRAWSLSEACRKVSLLPLTEWTLSGGDL